jgi:hypothetical protein
MSSSSCGTHPRTDRHGEHGGSRVKFLIVVAIIGVVGYIGFQYIPVAIQSYQLKDQMQQTINAAAVQGQGLDLLRKQLFNNAVDYGAPNDTSLTRVDVSSSEGRYQARIYFKRPITLPGYTYDYEFDNTVKSIDMINFK